MADNTIFTARVEADTSGARASLKALEGDVGSTIKSYILLGEAINKASADRKLSLFDKSLAGNIMLTSKAMTSLANATKSMALASKAVADVDISAGIGKSLEAFSQLSRGVGKLQFFDESTVDQISRTSIALKNVVEVNRELAQAVKLRQANDIQFSEFKQKMLEKELALQMKIEAHSEKMALSNKRSALMDEDNVRKRERHYNIEAARLERFENSKKAKLASTVAETERQFDVDKRSSGLAKVEAAEALALERQKAALINATTSTSIKADMDQARRLKKRQDDLEATRKLTAAAMAEEAALAKKSGIAIPAYITGAQKTNLIKDRTKIVDDTTALDNITASNALRIKQFNEEAEALKNVRFAAGDLSRTYAMMGAVGVAVPALGAWQAGKQEQAFADVIRTAGEGRKAAEDFTALKDSFQALSVEIPRTFTELSDIGKLGAQMGIPANSLKDFTETVARFSAVTGVGAEQSAMSFGRLANMLHLQSDEYNSFASEVAELGTKSVATELEILNVSQAIATSGHMAGMSSNDVLALSTSLASLKVPPEMARGSMMRIFATVNKSAVQGEQGMERFAKAMGMTNKSALDMWKNNPADFMYQLASAIGHVTDNAEREMIISKDLGFRNVRDIEVLKRLANGWTVYAKSRSDAADAQATSDNPDNFLTRASDIMFNTMFANLEMLKNAFSNFMASFGESLLKPLSVVFGALASFFELLSNLNNPLGEVIATFIGLVGVFALVRAGMAAMLSSFSSIIRVRSSLAELGVTGGISLKSLATAAKFAFGSVASDAAVASQRITALKAQIATTGPMVGTLSSYTTNSGIIIPNGFSKGGKSVGAEAAKASGAVDKLNNSMVVTGTAGAKAAGGSSKAASGVAKFAQTSAQGAKSATLLGGALGMLASNWGWVAIGALSLIPILTDVISMFDGGASAAKEASNAFVDAIGGPEGFAEALQQDARELASGLQSAPLGEVTIGFDEYGKAVDGAAQTTRYYMDETGNLKSVLKGTGDAFDDATIKIGKHTNTLIHDALTKSDVMKNFTTANLAGIEKKTGFNLTEYAKLLGKADDGKAATALIEQSLSKLKAERDAINSAITAKATATTMNPLVDSMVGIRSSSALKDIEAEINALSTLKNSVPDMSQIFKDSFASTEVGRQLADGLGLVEDSAIEAGMALKDLNDITDAWAEKAFGATNASMAEAEALEKFGEAIRKNKGAFDTDTSAGREVIKASQEAITASIKFADQQFADGKMRSEEYSAYIKSTLEAMTSEGVKSGLDISSAAWQEFVAEVQKKIDTPPIKVDVKTEEAKKKLDDIKSALRDIVGSRTAQINVIAPGLSDISNKIANLGRSRLSPLAPSKSGTGILDKFLGNQEGSVVSNEEAINSETQAIENQVDARDQQTKEAIIAGKASQDAGAKGASAAKAAGGAVKQATKDTKEAAKEVKTLAQYFEEFLGNLSANLKKAFTGYYRTSEAEDAYHSSLNKMRDAAKDAKKELTDLHQEIDKLNRTIAEDTVALKDAEMFGAIARKYGDTLRVEQYAAEANKYRSQIAENQGKIKENNSRSAEISRGLGNLDGFSKEAIENRANIRALQQDMMGLLEAYAATGATTQQLQMYADQLKQEFMKQGVALGFSRDALVKYAGAFNALSVAASLTQRIEITADDNGTIKALQTQINNLHGTNVPVTLYMDHGSIEALRQGLNYLIPGVAPGNLQKSLRGYASGGLVGGPKPTGSGDNLFALHNGALVGLRSDEFVMTRQAVSHYGINFMSALNNLSVPQVQQSAGVQVVQLVPSQIIQLANAVSTILKVDGVKLAETVSNRYTANTYRGRF